MKINRFIFAVFTMISLGITHAGNSGSGDRSLLIDDYGQSGGTNSTEFDLGFGKSDKDYWDNFWKRHGDYTPIELTHFWEEEFLKEYQCPNFYFQKHEDYIQYLYRLISISLLYDYLLILSQMESVKIAESKHGNKKNIGPHCSVTFSKAFHGCGGMPKGKKISEDMMKFLQRAEGKITNDIVLKLNQELSHEEKKKITHVDYQKICPQIHSEIQKICLEEDEYFSFDFLSPLNNQFDFFSVIKNSHIFKILNEEKMGESCLKRFTALTQKKAFQSKHQFTQFKNFVEILDQSTKEGNHPFRFPRAFKDKKMVGELFLVGALREYDALGLTQFLSSLSMKEKKPSPPLSPPVNKPTIVIQKPEDDKVVSVVKATETPAVKVEKIIPRSVFEESVFLSATKKSLIRLDMKQFFSEFPIEQSVKSKLGERLKDFYTQKALSDMKELDQLGSVHAPISLKFLKFLLTENIHQGLFNIQKIFGEQFFVVNDLENKTEAVFITMKLEESIRPGIPTPVQYWQLIINGN